MLAADSLLARGPNAGLYGRINDRFFDSDHALGGASGSTIPDPELATNPTTVTAPDPSLAISGTAGTSGEDDMPCPGTLGTDDFLLRVLTLARALRGVLGVLADTSGLMGASAELCVDRRPTEYLMLDRERSDRKTLLAFDPRLPEEKL